MGNTKNQPVATTKEFWEAEVRQSAAYEHAATLLSEIELAERKLAAMKNGPTLKTDAGQLASIDRMQAKLQRMWQ